MAPPLLAVAHGTRSAAGQARVRALAAAVARRGAAVRLAYVDVQRPSLAAAVAALPGPSVVVPLLLSSGYHVRADIPAALAGTGHAVAAPLGPDPVLAECLDAAVAAAGPCDAVVLAAAGSADPRARAEVRAVAAALRHPSVTVAFAAAGDPSVPHAVARLRQRGARRVTIAAYLLAEGRFHDGLHAAGATAVTPPLAGYPAVAELILRRYAAAAAG